MLINIEDNLKDNKHKNQEEEYAIGIDLGTTNSLISYVNKDGICKIIPINNSQNSSKTNNYLPSILFIEQTHNSQSTKIFVGEEAIYYANLKNQPYIKSIKRFMGQATKHQNYYPQELSAEILKKLKIIAEIYLKTEIKKAVITIPAYFDDNQRNATMQAANLAGIEVLRLISEPTAAALSYGLDSKQEGLYLVYDLGGGTFDISLLKMQKGIFNVLSTKGDTNLGGDDFDILIKDYILNILKIANNTKDFTELENQYLINYAKNLKENFYNNQKYDCSLILKSKQYNFTFTKQDLINCLSPIINKTIEFCQDVLTEQNITTKEINGIILVGGSTILPLLSELLIQKIPTTIISNQNPQEVVALGAGYLANSLIGKSSQHTLILDVLPLSLGIELFGDLTEKIILRNSKIPVSKSQEFTTQKDNQTKILINIVQGERELASKNRSLGKIILKNLTPQIAGKTKIIVNFTISQDGILTVKAKDKENPQNEVILDLKPTYGLSLEEMTEMLYDSIEHSKDDMEARLYKEQQVTAEYLINLLQNALKTDKELLTTQELTQIEEAIYTLEVFITKNQDFTQLKVLKQLIHHLEHISNTFAEKRMTNSIQTLLQGQKADDIIKKL